MRTHPLRAAMAAHDPMLQAAMQMATREAVQGGGLVMLEQWGAVVLTDAEVAGWFEGEPPDDLIVGSHDGQRVWLWAADADSWRALAAMVNQAGTRSDRK